MPPVMSWTDARRLSVVMLHLSWLLCSYRSFSTKFTLCFISLLLSWYSTAWFPEFGYRT